MRRYLWAPALLLAAGCNDLETGLVVLHAAAGDDNCAFEEDGDERLGDITFDSAQASTLMLVLRVRNNLQGGSVNFGNDENPDTFNVPSTVTPVRFDLRWECDSNGFSDDLGDLILPQFDPTEPFCLSENTRTFEGFDVIPASGNTIEPNGDVGLVEIRPITAQLGAAFNDVFQLAAMAQACCDDAPRGCDDQTLQSKRNGPGTPCGILQSTFDTIAGPNQLSAQRYEDLQKFRPFLVYDHAAVNPNGGPGPSPAYSLTLRGVLEGVTQDGSTVRSSEWRQSVHICANCSQSPCTNL